MTEGMCRDVQDHNTSGRLYYELNFISIRQNNIFIFYRSLHSVKILTKINVCASPNIGDFAEES